MVLQYRWGSRFDWNPPASEAAIQQAENEYGSKLPAVYVEFVRVANGGYTDGNLSILEIEDCVQRNQDYEVDEYLTGYFMVGDDGAGTAILICLKDGRIYECDTGVMDEQYIKLSADTLGELLELGTSLMERTES